MKAFPTFSLLETPKMVQCTHIGTYTWTRQDIAFRNTKRDQALRLYRKHRGKWESITSKGGHKEPLDDCETRHMANIFGDITCT